MDSIRMLLSSEIAATCQSPMSFSQATITITICCILGMLWSLYNYRLVKRIHVEDMHDI